MKKLLTALLISAAGVFLLFRSAVAWDGTYTGTITLVHLNSEVAGRGVCVMMNPALPQFGGWACLPTASPLYKEITSVIYMAYATEKTCSLWVLFNGAGYNEIRVAQCQ
jgi:hypothetical protein